MNIDGIIDELNKYCTAVSKDINKDIYKTTQLNLEDGSIGVIINELLEIKEFEGYLYIKRKDKIACPLLYKKFNNPIDATNYFNELDDMIQNKPIDYIIARCKTTK